MRNFSWPAALALLVAGGVSADPDPDAARQGLEARLQERAAIIEADIQAKLEAVVDAEIESADFVVFGAVSRMPARQDSPEPLVQAAVP